VHLCTGLESPTSGHIRISTLVTRHSSSMIPVAPSSGNLISVLQTIDSSGKAKEEEKEKASDR